jgi:hypothetical protein
MKESIDCPICKRSAPPSAQEKHHTVPRSEGGKDTIIVCIDCGDMVHQIFTLKELKKEFNSVEKIVGHEGIQKWVKWINKKPDQFGISMKKKKARRRRKKS